MLTDTEIIIKLTMIAHLAEKYRMKNRHTLSEGDWEFYLMRQHLEQNLRYFVDSTPKKDFDDFVKQFLLTKTRDIVNKIHEVWRPYISPLFSPSERIFYELGWSERGGDSYSYSPHTFLSDSVMISTMISGIVLSLDKERCMRLFDDNDDNFFKYLYNLTNTDHYIPELVSPWIIDYLKENIEYSENQKRKIEATSILCSIKKRKHFAKETNNTIEVPKGLEQYSYPDEKCFCDVIDRITSETANGRLIDPSTLPENIKLDIDKANLIYKAQGIYVIPKRKSFFSIIVAAILDKLKKDNANKDAMVDKTIELLRKIQLSPEAVDYPEYIKDDKYIAKKLVKADARYFISLSERLKADSGIFNIAVEGAGENHRITSQIYHAASKTLQESDTAKKLAGYPDIIDYDDKPCVGVLRLFRQLQTTTTIRKKPELSESDINALNSASRLIEVLKFQKSSGKKGVCLDYFNDIEYLYNKIPIFELIEPAELARMIKEDSTIVRLALDINRTNFYLIPFECFEDVEIIKICLSYGFNLLCLLPLNVLENMDSMVELLKSNPSHITEYLDTLQLHGSSQHDKATQYYKKQ